MDEYDETYNVKVRLSSDVLERALRRTQLNVAFLVKYTLQTLVSVKFQAQQTLGMPLDQYAGLVSRKFSIFSLFGCVCIAHNLTKTKNASRLTSLHGVTNL